MDSLSSKYMRQPEQKKPYQAPRVLQVQRRIDGDNLAVGCKVAGSAGPIAEPCTALQTCSAADLS